mgnify:CR=1 FL=1
MTDQLNILVTGGAGYLGSILVPALLGNGHRVTVLDSFMFGQNSLANVCADPNFDLIRGDARDMVLVADCAKQADVIIPLAALVGAPLCERDQIGAMSLNQDAVKNLVGVLGQDQRVIMPITNSGYGVGEVGKYCTETSPLNPITLYGKTKVAAEAFVLSRENGISLRLATVFGMAPRMRLDLLVNDFTYRAFYDKAIVLFEAHFKRNYLHINDAIDGFLFAIENQNLKGDCYNLGYSEANLSKLELCELIKKYVPKFVYHCSEIGEDPDKRNYIISNAKIESKGFKAVRSVDIGVQELLKALPFLKRKEFANI